MHDYNKCYMYMYMQHLWARDTDDLEALEVVSFNHSFIDLSCFLLLSLAVKSELESIKSFLYVGKQWERDIGEQFHEKL